MSAAIAVVTTAITTAAAAAVATLPEAHALLSPVTEGGAEYAVGAIAMLVAFPIVGLLTVAAAAAQD